MKQLQQVCPFCGCEMLEHTHWILANGYIVAMLKCERCRQAFAPWPANPPAGSRITIKD